MDIEKLCKLSGYTYQYYPDDNRKKLYDPDRGCLYFNLKRDDKYYYNRDGTRVPLVSSEEADKVMNEVFKNNPEFLKGYYKRKEEFQNKNDTK